MSTNPRYSQYGGASSPDRGTGVYTGKITLIYDDGRVRVFVNTFGRNIGPCRIVNKSAGDAISLNDEVLCTYANDTSDELIVIGRLTERVDPISESTSGLVVEATTTSELVRITQKGTGAALLVEDSTNVDSTPFIIDASGNVGIGTSSPSTKLDITGAAAISGDLTVDTSTLKVDSSNNRVGIGTASPATALDVIGTITARNASTQDGVALIGRSGGSSSYEVSIQPTTLSSDRTATLPDVSGTVITTGNLSDITSTGTLTSLTVTGELTIDTNTLRVDSTNNRIGINVTSPAHALDIIGRVETRAAATQDGVAIVGRSGGTSSYDVTLTPTTLSADRTLTLPNVTGTVVTTGDSGTVTSTMILDGTIVNGDINASAAIADTKLATISTALKVSNSATTATSSNTASAIVARDASGNFTAGTITAALTGNASTSTKAGSLGNGGVSGTAMTFNWSGQSGQPTWLWGGNDISNMYVWNPSNFSVSSAGSSNATTFTGTYLRMSGNGDADPYDQQGLQSGAGGTGAGVAIWASGVAPQFRVGAGNPTVYLRNSNDSAYQTLEAIITNVSSVHLKQDIEEFPKIVKSVGAAVNELEFDTGLDIVRRLRPVTYRWKEDEHFYQLPENPRRALALARLNKLRKENGLEPYKSDELKHDCARDNCTGTAENPCAWTKNWDIGNLGFISQEVGEVIPQAAIIGKDNEFTSLDSIAMVAVAVAAIKEMDATITLLKQRIETLENK